MAKEKFGNLISYFRPVMPEAHNDTRPMCAVDIGASSGDHGDWVCTRPCIIDRLIFAVTIEAASGTSVAPTVVYTKRLLYGSATGGSAMGTITVPTGTAIGKVMYKDITPVQFAVGDCVHVAWTIGTGTPTGIGEADCHCIDSYETAANNTDMIASA